MSEKKIENLFIENYENEFSYKENKSNLNISFNRIAFIFFIFFIVFIIYSIKIFYLGSLHSDFLSNNNHQVKKNFRANIIDRNGNFVAKTVNTLTVGIDPNLIIDEKRLLINLKLIFPKKNFKGIDEKIKKKNIFDLKKNSVRKKLKNFDSWEIKR